MTIYRGVVPGLLLLALVFPVLSLQAEVAQLRAAEMPRLLRTANRVDLIVDGQPFLMIAGELRNSSSSSLDPENQVGPGNR